MSLTENLPGFNYYENDNIKMSIANINILNSDKEKRGFNLGIFVEHPFINGRKIPIFVANFVL